MMHDHAGDVSTYRICSVLGGVYLGSGMMHDQVMCPPTVLGGVYLGSGMMHDLQALQDLFSSWWCVLRVRNDA